MLGDGNYNWTCNATDDDDEVGWANANRSLVVDTTAPVITSVWNITNITTFNLPVNSKFGEAETPGCFSLQYCRWGNAGPGHRGGANP